MNDYEIVARIGYLEKIIADLFEMYTKIPHQEDKQIISDCRVALSKEADRLKVIHYDKASEKEKE